MKRSIKINKSAVSNESKNSLKKVFSFHDKEATTKGDSMTSIESNVFIPAREGIKKGGKFYQMFAAGDGHELEDYTDEQGCFHLAHAKSLYSSSMLAYNFFHWICTEHPLTLNNIVYNKVYFEVKFPVIAKSTKGRPVNRPSNMDVVLISDDCTAMLCIESKYTEHTHNQAAKFSDAYFKPSCYYQGNPYRTAFVQMALYYNEKNNGYYAGIKQNISHLIGITNIMHDADALAWFKANNPFIEPEVKEKLCAQTEIIFTNLLYFHPENSDEIYGNIHAEEKSYPYLLGELLFDHLQKSLDEPLLLSSFIKTYPELFKEAKPQMPLPGLQDYLDNRYVLEVPKHFPLPEGYDTADHYLIDMVIEGARARYNDDFTDEVSARIKTELALICHRQWSDRFLIMWDALKEARNHGFQHAPGGSNTPGSIVAYCLGITDVEPIHAGLSETNFLYRPALPSWYIDFSDDGQIFVLDYLTNKYGPVSPMLGIYHNKYINMVENVIAREDPSLDFGALPYESPELIQFFIHDDHFRDYTCYGIQYMEKLRELENPTFEDMVYTYSHLRFKDGSQTVLSREHSYTRCVLITRMVWLKMHYPDAFLKAVEMYT